VIRFITEEGAKFVILGWTVYHLITEIKQAQNTRTMTGSLGTYFSDIWNTFDWIRLTCSISYLICAFTPGNSKYAESELFGFIMLFSWICLIQYLRIFSEFRYLATLIVSSVYATLSFLAVQLILMFGFSLAFFWRSIDTIDMDEHVSWFNRFLGVFYITFGDFHETDYYTSGFDWVYFFFANLLICVVMMNLLIGILSEELAKIIENRDQLLYDELLDLIITLEMAARKEKD
jgi:hypothetical protein